MRFEDYQKERLLLLRAEDLLDRVGRREYVLRRVLDEPDEHGDFCRHPPVDEIKATVQVWILGLEGEGIPSISIQLYQLHHGHINNPLSELTPTEFVWLGQIREWVDQWIDGQREVLPLEMPWEASLPKL